MDPAYDPFDLRRMFIGDFSALLMAEIAVRTAIMYVFALFAVRLIGKRGIGNLSPFEYVLVFALGSATGDPMFYPEVPLVHGMVSITMIVLLQRFVQRATQKNAFLEQVLESRASLLIASGAIREDELRRQELSKDELFMKLRLAGVMNVGKVRYAWLEPSGALSVFQDESLQVPGASTLASTD